MCIAALELILRDQDHQFTIIIVRDIHDNPLPSSRTAIHAGKAILSSIIVCRWCAPKLRPGWIMLVNIIIMRPITDRVISVKSDTQDFTNKQEFVGNWY